MAGGVKAADMRQKWSACERFAYPAERNTLQPDPIADPIVKKTDLEKLKGLKIANNLKRDNQRTGKPGQGAAKPVPQNKLLKALLSKPADSDQKKP